MHKRMEGKLYGRKGKRQFRNAIVEKRAKGDYTCHIQQIWCVVNIVIIAVFYIVWNDIPIPSILSAIFRNNNDFIRYCYVVFVE